MGTAWDGTSDRDPVAFEFRPGGVLHYTSPSGAFDDGTWVQKGRNVTFEMSGHFAEYEGIIDAKTMKGTAHNQEGKKWTWAVATDPDFVVLPQDVHCSLHDTKTTFGFENGKPKGQLTSVKAITCRINGPEKDVPLVGIQPDGSVLTKDFGRLKIPMGSTGYERIEIQVGQLKSFREFLQGSAATGSSPSASAAPSGSMPNQQIAIKVLPVQVQGRLDPEVIKRVVRSKFAGFRACYERGLEKDASLHGNLHVRFTIGKTGAAESVGIEGATMGDPEFSGCIVDVYKSLAFPTPEGGKVSVISGLGFQAN